MAAHATLTYQGTNQFSVNIVFSIDPVPRSKVIIYLMRFAANIVTRLITLLALGVVLVAPMASAVDTHDCCPETYQDGVRKQSHDLMAHYGQGKMISHETASDHMDADPTSPENLCDISCCANVAACAVVSLNVTYTAGWTVRPQTFRPIDETASSGHTNLRTPPPRISLIV